VKWVFTTTVAAACAAFFLGNAHAAQLIDRNATNVKIATNTKGEALITYTKGGATRHVLVWGAMGAKEPSQGGKQVSFKVDYSGGYKEYRPKVYWKTFGSYCGQYDGPAIPNMVAACRAKDGTYWAAQSWQRALPDLGFAPWTPALSSHWLEISHWTGDLAQIQTGTDWVYSGRYEQIFGRVTYGGSPVYGFGTTRVGAPTDAYGRLVYLDTFNSSYGTGWRRENSFVPHNPTGVFCYGFYSFDPTKGGYQHPPGQTGQRGPGVGQKYRLTLSGPGVTPNVEVVINGQGSYDKNDPTKTDMQRTQSAVLASWNDKQCKAGTFEP
jgi:hypothetical protein